MFNPVNSQIASLRSFADKVAHKLFGKEHYDAYLELRGRIDDLEYACKECQSSLYPKIISFKELFDLDADTPIFIEYAPGNTVNEAKIEDIRNIIAYDPSDNNMVAFTTYGRKWRVWLKPTRKIQDYPTEELRREFPWGSQCSEYLGGTP